jgi:hypothetical protein
MKIRLDHFSYLSLVLSTVALAVSSCSDSKDGEDPFGGGAGAAATGGTSTGGTPGNTGGVTPTGGTVAKGGTGAGPTGGSISTGGAVATGGSSTSGSGGSPVTGGTDGKGGAPATGGAGATAGASATGGSGGGASPQCASVMPVSKSTCAAGESNCFSFFVASRARMFAAAEKFNGSTKGWGGDFRYGTGDGLTGADKLCTEIAEQSLPGNCRKWRAFLSTTKVNAIDRVGTGPWYDRLNRTIANNLTELVDVRPGGITVATIRNNLPNEDGTPHHDEEVGCSDLNDCADNHDVLTGSDTDGKLCTATTCPGFGFGGGRGGIGGMTGGGATTLTDQACEDWTLGTSKAGIAPRCGHTWPTRAGGGSEDDWISILTENGCAPGYNLVQNGGPMPTGMGSVGDGGGYGAIYCLALGD